jgi:hypothetical protein
VDVERGDGVRQTVSVDRADDGRRDHRALDRGASASSRADACASSRVCNPEISGLNSISGHAQTLMITKDLFLAKDFNRIGTKILRDHVKSMRTRR